MTGVQTCALPISGVIEEVRGEGLMLGLKLVPNNGEFAAAARGEHVLVIPAGDNVVRLLPPLIIDDAIVNEAVTRIDHACTKLENDMGLSASKGAA